MSQVKIHGLKDLEKSLMNLDLRTAGKVLRVTLKETAKPIFSDIKNSSPVKTGALKESVRLTSSVGRSKRSKYSARARIVIGGKGTKRRKTAGHALTVEYGNSNRSAKPFIRPAFDKNVNKALSEFKNRLKQNIREVAKSGK